MPTLSARLKKAFHTSNAGGRNRNPYSDPMHPNHNTLPPTPITHPWSQTSPHLPYQHQPPPQPASPRGSLDFLAEAREAASRDPVTGRPLAIFAHRAHQQQQQWSPAEQAQRGETSAYAARTESIQAQRERLERRGSRYEMFVAEMKRLREGERAAGKEVARREREGYYAPAPKEAVEYYAPETVGRHGVGGW